MRLHFPAALRVRLILGALLLGVVGLPASSAQIVVDNFNTGTTSGSPSGSWTGQITTTATTVTVGGSATDISGWSGAFSTPTVNASSMGYVQIIARVDAGNTAPAFTVQFFDAGLTLNGTGSFSVPTSAFAGGSLTTVQIPIADWGSGFDPSQITDWVMGGGNPAGNSTFHMTFDNLALTAGLSALNGGTIITAGNQVYGTAQIVTAATTLGNTNGSNGTGTAITFSSTLDGANNLTLNTSGTLTFNGAVGSTTPLGNLVTDAGGTTIINGGLVKTTGSQTYNDAVSLGGNALFQSAGGGAVAFLDSLTGNNHTVEVDVDGNSSMRSAASVTTFTKSGPGNLTLTGTSTYTGNTVLSGGTFTLGISNALASASRLTMNGGTFALSGHTQSLGLLALSANSVFNFGAGATLSFANSSGQTWSGTLTITNYDTSTNSLRFGADNLGLTASQLSNIRFADYGNAFATIDSSGFIAPSAIPEPGTWGVIAGLAGLGVAFVRRRLGGRVS